MTISEHFLLSDAQTVYADPDLRRLVFFVFQGVKSPMPVSHGMICIPPTHLLWRSCRTLDLKPQGPVTPVSDGNTTAGTHVTVAMVPK